MFPLIQLPRKSEALLFDVEPFGGNVSINSTSEEVRRRQPPASPTPPRVWVSINSTSEEVRSLGEVGNEASPPLFPLIQLPRKSEAMLFRPRP